MRQTAQNASAHDTETHYNLGELHSRKIEETATRQRRKVSRSFQRLPSRRILLKHARSSGQFSVQRTRVLQDGDAILEPGDEAAGFKRAVSWETLLTCCFTPHRLFSFLERAGSSQTQGLPATGKQTAKKRKQPSAPTHADVPNPRHAIV